MKEVNSSIISSNIHVMPSLPNMHYKKFMTLSWHSVDGQCQNGAVTVPPFLLPMMDGNMSVMDNNEQITYQLLYSNGHISLRLHWRSFSEWRSDSFPCFLTVKPANILVTHNRKHIPFQSPYLHYQISLMLCWRAVEGGSDIDTNHVANKGFQCVRGVPMPYV